MPTRSPAQEGSLLHLAIRAHDEGVTTIVEDHGAPLAAVVPIGMLDEVNKGRIAAAMRAAADRDAAHGEAIDHRAAMEQLGLDERGRSARAVA